MPHIDVFGDIHGRADLLQHALKRLGYEKVAGAYRHPDRKALFVGDIINRGKRVKKCIQIVRAMIDAGAARMILGNHEYEFS